jgi:hypothetical protein
MTVASRGSRIRGNDPAESQKLPSLPGVDALVPDGPEPHRQALPAKSPTTGGTEPQDAGQIKGNEGRLLLEPALTAS